MSLKIDRYNSTFQKVISQILMEVKDQKLKSVVLTGVEITNDLSYAKVFYTILDNVNKKEIEESLEKNKSYIRGQISKRVDIRHTPELRFYFDNSIEYGDRIEKIISDINTK
ncbi:MAG: 30S ribosome-binding factor RbfA [Bacilli bacterium]|nr:30S ribosome-binding factor RbfA [Bacilli bacterium]